MQKLLFTDGWTFGLKGAVKTPVVLPHDAMQLQERNAGEESGSGCAYFPGGCYTYEKQWMVPESYAGKQIILHFEGVYRNSTVSVNGSVVGGKPYGYIPFQIDITDVIKPGEINVIRVEADNSDVPNSRWYSGGGIYRPVWIWVGEKINITPCGIKVTTLSIDPARVKVSVDTNASDTDVEIIYEDNVVANASGNDAEIEITDAKLWDDEHPYLYVCRVSAKQDGQVVDTAEVSFGIRTIECSTKGLFINGKETLLRGGCIHSDNGVIGSASFPEAEYRKVKLLKDAGFNALRIAHNPAAPGLLDACDRLGMYVMDEGWDMWYKRKTRYDYGIHFMDHYEEDIQAMVDTDYNHPSVIMYSIGNEISEPAEAAGLELAGKLADGFRKADGTRKVTVGCNIMILTGSAEGQEAFDPDSEGSAGSFEAQFEGEMDSTKFNEIVSNLGTMFGNAASSQKADDCSSPLFEKVDIAGYNYASCRYEKEGEKHPDRVVVGSETFPHEIYTNWQMVKKLPYLIGDFMWTAMDYIGEVGIGAWSYDADGIGFTKPYPWVLGDVGAVDLIGTPTGELYWAQSAWSMLDNPAISVSPDVCHPGVVAARGSWRGTNSIPSWSFADCDGNPTTVEVFSEASEVELFINGESLGKKAPENGRAVFECVYASGTIEAVSYDADGQEKGYSMMESAIGDVSIRLTHEAGPDTVKAGSVVFVDVDIVGENGIVESNKDREIEVNVTGGTLLGFGSGKARTEDKLMSGRYTTHYGRALAAVLVGETGKAKLTAAASDMKAEITIE